jgi:uncharacterized membrane-anchored protein
MACPSLKLHRVGILGGMLLYASLSFSAQGTAPRWISGPKKVDLGQDVAQLDVKQEYLFADASETRRLLESMGNTTDGTEVGLVVPTAQDQDWMMVFEWAAEGYIKDDDKNKIDKNAILKSYQEGTEQANENRRKKGLPGMHVVGWFEEPHYDEATHNLVWALLAKNDDNTQTVNYNMRLLGREGYMSVTLIDEPRRLAQSKPYVKTVLGGFAYKSGKTYAEFRAGDKVAKYGLAALVAGGGAAAAAKLGLFGALAKVFAKAGKALIVGFVAVVAFLRKAFAALFRRLRGQE